jgi:DNA-binding transcriptional regulator YbjK
MTSSATEKPLRRRRDPQARRQEIIAAAVDLIVEGGPDSITHRMVAARAGVPLGSTTQHFATLDDLKAAAFQHLHTEWNDAADDMRRAVDESDDLLQALVDEAHSYLMNPRMVIADLTLTTAALRKQEPLLSIALGWFDQLAEILTPRLGESDANAIALLLHGASWVTALRGDTISREALAAMLAPHVKQRKRTPASRSSAQMNSSS